MNRFRLSFTVLRFTLQVILCVVGAGWEAVALARSSVIVTVDVESTTDLPLPEQVDAICADGSRCGLMEMVRLLDQKHLAGTFFLNVYEYKSYGTQALRDIAVRLQRAGQDVALHTHPQWAYDATRPYMYGYNLEQQTQIVHDGVELLKAWTGLPVIAHRAGAYSADLNTIEALHRNGIQVDSSLFYKHPASRLNGLGLPNNLPSIMGGVIEIPVSVYERQEFPAGLGAVAAQLSSIRKLDVNSLMSEEEAHATLARLVQADFPYIIVFLHSFSFIDKPGVNGRGARADHKARRVFESLLGDIVAAHLPTTTISALATTPDVVATGPRDGVPQVAVAVPMWRYLWHARHSRSGIAMLGGLAAAIVLLAVLAARRLHPSRSTGLT